MNQSQENTLPCVCHDPQSQSAVYEEKFVGVERSHYGDVSLRTCTRCQGIWLHCLLEYEMHTGAGRYYRGLISPEVATQVTPDSAVSVLESLEWCLYGGSWFGHSGRRSAGPVTVAFL